MLIQDAIEMVESKTVHLSANTVRNGQVEYIKGDALFIGNLHKGGILKASGNIFLLGKCEGIVHAGYLTDAQAIIVGNVSKAQQVRIADVVDIISENQEVISKDEETVVYVNDLHVLDYTKREQIKKLGQNYLRIWEVTKDGQGNCSYFWKRRSWENNYFCKLRDCTRTL